MRRKHHLEIILNKSTHISKSAELVLKIVQEDQTDKHMITQHEIVIFFFIKETANILITSIIWSSLDH